MDWIRLIFMKQLSAVVDFFVNSLEKFDACKTLCNPSKPKYFKEHYLKLRGLDPQYRNYEKISVMGVY